VAVAGDMVGWVVEVPTGKAAGRTGPGNSVVGTANNADYRPLNFRNPALESAVVVGEQKGLGFSQGTKGLSRTRSQGKQAR